MGIPLEQVWAALDSLLDYAQQRELLCDDDRIYARNLLLGDLGLEQYVPQSRRLPFPDCLELLCCFGVQQGLCGDTVAQRDLLDTRLMGRLTPPPSQVIGLPLYPPGPHRPRCPLAGGYPLRSAGAVHQPIQAGEGSPRYCRRRRTEGHRLSRLPAVCGERGVPWPRGTSRAAEPADHPSDAGG